MRDAKMEILEMAETKMNIEEYIILRVIGKVALIYLDLRFLC